jgi:hypothetical protein
MIRERCQEQGIGKAYQLRKPFHSYALDPDDHTNVVNTDLRDDPRGVLFHLLGDTVDQQQVSCNQRPDTQRNCVETNVVLTFVDFIS